MRIEVVTLFPPLVEAGLTAGVLGRAIAAGKIEVGIENPRSHAVDVHRTVDDRPFGGGPGMVMKAEPLARAVAAVKGRLPADSPVFGLSAQGVPFDQAVARRLAGLEGFALVAGRYEGIDERVVEAMIDEELSIGDYVLSGGELPALVVVDAVARLLPGVLGDAQSAAEDSFGGVDSARVDLGANMRDRFLRLADAESDGPWKIRFENQKRRDQQRVHVADVFSAVRLD